MSQLPIVSSDVEALPTRRPTSGERLRRIGVRSLLALPLVAGGEVLGGLALVSTTTHRSWPERGWSRTAGWSPTSSPGPSRACSPRTRCAPARP